MLIKWLVLLKWPGYGACLYPIVRLGRAGSRQMEHSPFSSGSLEIAVHVLAANNLNNRVLSTGLRFLNTYQLKDWILLSFPGDSAVNSLCCVPQTAKKPCGPMLETKLFESLLHCACAQLEVVWFHHTFESCLPPGSKPGNAYLQAHRVWENSLGVNPPVLS